MFPLTVPFMIMVQLCFILGVRGRTFGREETARVIADIYRYIGIPILHPPTTV